MSKRIGNVGVLNLLNATAESVKSAGRIGNIGAVLYRAGQGHVLTSLSAGNIGATVEVPDGYSYYDGLLEIDRAYLESLNKPLKLVVIGSVLIKEDVTADLLDRDELELIVHGDIYSPATLKGAVSQRFSGGSRKVKSYSGELRLENGNFILSNAFLESMERPVYLKVNGKLELPKELDLGLFNEKVANIEVNGLVQLCEEQETAFYKKAGSAVKGSIEVIPSCFERLKKTFRLNNRSIRSMQGRNVYTKKPILFETDVRREKAEEIGEIHSSSFIVCNEELEDIMYRKLAKLETEVLSYADNFIFIEGDQEWSEAQLQAIEQPAAVIVEGKLTFAEDVKPASVKDKIATLDLFGEIQTDSAEVRAALQTKLRANEGLVSEIRETGENNLQNIGELSL